MDERSIVHLNVADFAVAVERVVDPRCKGRPVLIAPEGAVRASVFDMSDEAFERGVRKGMALRCAKRLCPDAYVVPPHPERYERAMHELCKRALPYSPLVERTDSNGHVFIDTTGTSRLFGPAYDIAWRIRKAVRTELGFDPIWSVAPNKLVAKVATRLVKPRGEYIIEAGEEEAFLEPVPTRLLPGLEAEDLARLGEVGLFKVADLRAWTLQQLETMFPGRGRFLYETARGIDASPVLPFGRRRPVVTREYDFCGDTNEPVALEAALYVLAENIGAALRAQRLVARRLWLFVDYSDGTRLVGQTPLERATANDVLLFDAARRRAERLWRRRVRIRHLRLTADRLGFPHSQMGLFQDLEGSRERWEALMDALDALRERFGSGAVRVGRTLL